MTDTRQSFGILARFANTTDLVAAARHARAEGYTQLDAYTPHPVEGLAEVLGFRDRRVPFMALLFAVLGGTGALLLQVWSSLDYPFNIGGRPLVSWPAYMIVVFAASMIGATFGAVISMLALNGFPKPYHPVLNVQAFNDASRDGYFLCLEASDSRFDREQSEKMLYDQGASQVWEVEP